MYDLLCERDFNSRTTNRAMESLYDDLTIKYFGSYCNHRARSLLSRDNSHMTLKPHFNPNDHESAYLDFRVLDQISEAIYPLNLDMESREQP